MGRHGVGSKVAINKDLVENIEKEVEKLKRQKENIQIVSALFINSTETINSLKRRED